MAAVGIKPFDILNNRWEVNRKVGQGTFCHLYVGRDVLQSFDDSLGGPSPRSDQLVAIKVASEGVESAVIRSEAEVLKHLVGVDHVPQFIHLGSENDRQYLVMDFLSGEDMSHLRNRVRSNSKTGLVPFPAACYLARQMLACIKALHGRGLIHRDIKPANFVRKSKESTEFSIIDFGISKMYRDKDGKIRPSRGHAEMRGTTTYASPNMHRGEDHCPRDDLYSLMLVFIDLICGKLPWTDSSRAKDKKTVAALKEDYLADPQNLITWVVSTVAEVEAAHSEAAEEYGTNFPLLAQNICLTIFKHVQSLQYTDVPDYDLIEKALRELVDESVHDVGSISYRSNGFAWDLVPEKPMFRRENSQVAEPVDQKLKLLRVRINHVSSKVQQSSSSATSSAATPTSPTHQIDAFDVVAHFRSIVKLLSSVAEELITMDVLYSVESLLKEVGRFYEYPFVSASASASQSNEAPLLDESIDEATMQLSHTSSSTSIDALLDSEAHWQMFVDVQRDIFHIMEIKERVQKRIIRSGGN